MWSVGRSPSWGRLTRSSDPLPYAITQLTSQQLLPAPGEKPSGSAAPSKATCNSEITGGRAVLSAFSLYPRRNILREIRTGSPSDETLMLLNTDMTKPCEVSDETSSNPPADAASARPPGVGRREKRVSKTVLTVINV